MIDLHTHSTASDGTDSPGELIEKAARAGLEAIALTDHDTLAGLDEAEDAARDLGIYFVRGCEVSTRSDLGSTHILGLWVPKKSDVLQNFLKSMREKRDERNAIMIAKLRALGFDITLEEVAAMAGGSVGRPHMATVLVEKGYAADRKEVFSKYLGAKGSAYVPKATPEPAVATRLLASAGATVSFAHPLLPPPRPLSWLERLTLTLSAEGLSAIEVWHSEHRPQDSSWLKALAKRSGLCMTGGSDYHGLAKPGIVLGKGRDNLDISRDVLDSLLLARKKAGLPV